MDGKWDEERTGAGSEREMEEWDRDERAGRLSEG